MIVDSSSRIALWTSIALATVGCQFGGVSFTPIRNPPHALTPRSAKRVEVFVAASPPAPFVEIGLIEARAAQGMSERDVIDTLRRRAGEIGCDAIVIVGGIEKESSYGKIAYEGGGLRSSCIVYTGTPTIPIAAPVASGAPVAKPAPSTPANTTTQPSTSTPSPVTSVPVSSFPPP